MKKKNIAIGRLLAEFLGCFFLVLTGCGAVIINEKTGVLGHLGISMVFGAIIMIMIYSYGSLSGAHFNPAVTIAFWLSGRFEKKDIPGYLIVQFAGALAGAFLLKALFPESGTMGETLPADGTAIAFVLEALFTFLLMTVILNVSTGHMEKGIMAGVAIGGTVFLLATIGGPLTGASMNPARSLGPALAAGKVQALWLYLTAPVLGAALAVYPGKWTTCQELCGETC